VRNQFFQKKELQEICFRTEDIQALLGLPLSLLTDEKIETILKNLACQVHQEEKTWKVIPPSYRLDLKIKEDLAEEIARSIGYEHIPSTLPSLGGFPTFSDAHRLFQRLSQTRKSLCCLGLYEVINSIFTSPQQLALFGFKAQVKLLNPVAEDKSVLIASLIPGLVKNALYNEKHHFGSDPLAIRLFELRPLFFSQGENPASSQWDTGIQEKWKLAFLVSGPQYAESLVSEQREIDFYDVKGIVEQLFLDFGVKKIQFKVAHLPYLHPGKSAQVWLKNQCIGNFGLLHPRMSMALKTRSFMWVAELDWQWIQFLDQKPRKFEAVEEFPNMERDFALLVPLHLSAEQVCQVARHVARPLAKKIRIFDIYQGSQVPDGMKSIAVRITFYHPFRTLFESEVERVISQILAAWKRELEIDLRNSGEKNGGIN